MPLLGNDDEEAEVSGSKANNSSESGSKVEHRGDESSVQEDSSQEDIGSEEEHGDESENESEQMNADPTPEFQNPVRPERRSSRGKAITRGRGAKGRGGAVGNGRTKNQTEEKPSLRELQNQAYSRSTLHTFRSHLLHKRHGPDIQGQSDRGRGRGRGIQIARGRGQGQPDMRLRMNAMLEKIKRDYT